MAMPTTGALLINPRRRRRKATRRKSTKSSRSRAAKLGWARRRRNGTKAGSRRKTARRAYVTKNRRRKTRRRSRARTTRRRRNTRKGAVRTSARRAYRRNTRAGARRKTARRAYMRTPTRRRRRNTRRRYTRRRNSPNMLNAISQPLKKIPVIGPIASDAVQLGIPAAFGAISIEPVMFGLKYAGNYLPKGLQKISFTIGGMIMGALVKRFLPGSPEVRKQFAVALATAGGAVDYYRWKTGQGTVQAMTAAEKAGWGELEMEAMDGLGELELAMDGFGDYDDDDDMDGFGELELAVDGWGEYDEDDFDGFGDFGDMGGWGDLGGYGELELAEDVGNFTDPDTYIEGFGEASAADATVSGDDMEEIEADAILAGPEAFHAAAYGAARFARRPAFRRTVHSTLRSPSVSSSFTRTLPGYTPKTPVVGAQSAAGPYYESQTSTTSRHAGRPFGRWFWLVKLYGYKRAMQVAKLPRGKRRAYITQLRQTAIANHPGLYAAVAQMAGASAF